MEKCLKHPKYKGKRKPKRECVGCLSLYFLLHSKPRGKPLPPNKIELDETKYRRKRDKKVKPDEWD